jgi:hypothetical protein
MATHPIRQIEEAIFLLRRQDMRGWLQYLLAAVPLLLTLLMFVHDMSARYLANRCALESLICVMAFFWANAWKAKFGGTLLASMNGPASPSPQGSFWRALYLQSILQTLKLIALPFAIASILPAAWTSSFFRNAAIEASLPDSTLRTVISKSARRASVNARGNWQGLSILILIFLLTFVNVYALTLLLPFLFRMFTGVETLFTLDSKTLVSFSVFCVVVAVTWLLIDPLVLSYAVVRCFYTEARTDGRDLLARLRPAVAAIAVLLLALTPVHKLSAQDLSVDSVSKEKLSRAVEHASKSDDYAWLRAQQISKDGENSFLARLNHDINNIFQTVGSWLSGIRNWLRRLFEKAQPDSPNPPPERLASGGDVRWLLYALAALVLVAALIVVWRSRVKTPEPGIVSSAAIPMPDLHKENVLASDLPEEEWLRLAREFLAQGEFRLAVRAMYLSNLSYLGSQQFIQIARSKSNSIYERELRLRPRGTQVFAPFAQSNRSFERAWYGFHEVTPEFVAVFQQDVEAIRQHVKA